MPAPLLPGVLLIQRSWLAARVEQTAQVWGCPESRTNATLWWYSASQVLIGMAVRSLVLGGELADLSPEAIGFTVRGNGYLERVVPGPALPAQATAALGAASAGASLVTSPAATEAALGGHLGRHLDDVLERIIEPLADVGAASEQALWAIAADSLATTVLAATAVTPGGSARAADLAVAIAQAGSHLRPLPRFTEILLSDRPAARYVQRGSCCLLYRVPDGKCLSCPNQTPDERRQRLTQHARNA